MPWAPALPASPALHALMSSTLGSDDAAYALIPHAGGCQAAIAGGATAQILDGGVQVSAGGHRWALSAAAVGRRAGAGRTAMRSAARTPAANRVTFAGRDVEAWFVNGPSGLEQGWTLRRRPAGRGDLLLSMASTGDLRASLAADGRGILLAAASGGQVLRYSGLAAYDARGRQLAARFDLQGRQLVLRVEDDGATYPLTVDPFVQVAKLLASDGAAMDSLGSSVAISDDGATVVAGSPGANVLGHGSAGAVYVFSRPAAGWANATQTAKLTAADGAADDMLGYFPHGVAISADGSTIVAAALYAKVGSNSEQGAVYVFARSGQAWASQTQQAKLVASDGAAGDNLRAVSVSGDGATVVASTFAATVDGHQEQGAAYVFSRPGTLWTNSTQTAKLTAADGVAEDGLGVANAISADGATIAASADASIDGHISQGAVYVFARPAGAWLNATQTAKLTAADGAADDQLGFGLAMSGDGTTIVAGAAGAQVGSNGSQGAAYVFTRPGSAWSNGTQTAKLTQSDGAADDLFGESLGVSDDSATVVGATRFATVAGHTSQGAAYVFERSGPAWTDQTQAAKLTAADGQSGDEMGQIALSGDGSTVVAGAIFATVAGRSQQGALYIFNSRCTPGATTLCLDDQPGDGRWQVKSIFSTSEGGGHAGDGQAISLASVGVSHGGLFWFFDATNPEMLLKVLNGCAVNQQFWVFSSATTNVGFTVQVIDSHTGRSKIYSNPDGTAALPVQDTAAFGCFDGDVAPAAPPAAPAPPARLPAALAASAAGAAAPPPVQEAGCTATSTSLCINGRFAVKAHYHTAQGGGSEGSGQAIGLQSLGVAQGGLLWFFAADNPEMLVKVLDACAVNNRYWIFYAAGTNVGFTVTVTDTQTNQVKTYTNPDQTAAKPVQDTAALPCD